MRHVIPGDSDVEQQFHKRFEPARIRGEWFGREYLPIILAFAGGLADHMIQAYDGSGTPPQLRAGSVRTDAETVRIRREIERLWRAGHQIEDIAKYAWLEVDEIEYHLEEMRKSRVWDVHTRGGYWMYGDRVLPRAPRPRTRRAKPSRPEPQ
jgi:hypothetical protein